MEKSLALMQHLDLPYFQVNGVYFQGDEVDAKNESQQWFEKMDKPFNNDDFEEWCNEKCLLVEEDYEYIDDNYLVLTDEEADEKAEIYISETVWAFNASFIINHSNLPYEAIEMVQAFQREKCEDANETILALINDFDEFVSDAISADGRGDFLSSYDGKENEEMVNGETYYIYRN
jgi:hypothetical protein